MMTDEKAQREKVMKDKLDKIYSTMKAKNFSRVVKEKMLPKIDESKKKEIEDRINYIENKPYIRKPKSKSIFNNIFNYNKILHFLNNIFRF